MENSTRKRLGRLVIILSIGFVTLFVFRIIYGYNTIPDKPTMAGTSFEAIADVTRNYASKKYKQKAAGLAVSAVQVDQKYEKVASINTRSAEFDEDDKQTRIEIANFNALIQFEQRMGNKGDRRLNMVIGVPPENFDSLYSHLINIGAITSKQITKKDKTNEYKELNAKKNSLEQTHASLVNLKTKGGKIEEFMRLENRILEIEQQLQALGVSLGDFDDENEFCTVKLSLAESTLVTISFIHRVKVAFEWTVQYSRPQWLLCHL